jgi:hypothetical protein
MVLKRAATAPRLVGFGSLVVWRHTLHAAGAVRKVMGGPISLTRFLFIVLPTPGGEEDDEGEVEFAGNRTF